MNKNNDRRLIQKGDYLSPGLYMQYWAVIVHHYGEKDAFKLNHLKQYREMRVGAILAALWTSTTKEPWFVGMPNAEPSDIELLRLVPTTMASGRDAFTQEIIQVQVTRCSTLDGEDIVEQIRRKNKANLSRHTLIVDVTGEGQVVDLSDVAKRLRTIGDLYPQEIAILTTIVGTQKNPAISNYLQYLLHPVHRTSQVLSSDVGAFFFEPTIINLKRGVSRLVAVADVRNLAIP